MYTVYVLRDDTGKFYKGFTNNLERRVREHCSGSTRSTKGMQNIKVVHTEDFDSVSEARKREVYFKTAAGRRFLKNAIDIRP